MIYGRKSGRGNKYLRAIFPFFLGRIECERGEVECKWEGRGAKKIEYHVPFVNA